MPADLPIGYDDFRKVRETGLRLVDKTGLIQAVIDQVQREVLLIPRPRRFGKSLNLSMLRYFFEKTDEDLSGLFEGLEIWQAGDRYRAHFQRFPLIYLSFKGVKSPGLEHSLAKLRLIFQAQFQYHAYLLEGDTLQPPEAERFRAVLEGRADLALLERALYDLTLFLHRHHGQRAFILIDEYDEPLHSAHHYGYAEPMISFMRNLLTEALKSNPHLERAVLTGILRVARESIFSGLNNLGVFTVLRPEFSQYFGFSEAEVLQLLEERGEPELLETLRTWYNGYLFGGQPAGGQRVYNPWSVANFLGSQDREPRNYWLNSSSNDLLRELLQHYAIRLEPDLQRLLSGEALELPIDENVVLSELKQDASAFWSLLLFSGYLTAEQVSHGPGEPSTWRLSIPNREIREIYTSTFKRWLHDRLERQGERVDALCEALLAGDAAELQALLQAFVTDVLSIHDAGSRRPENIYHGFVAGLLSVLEPEYQVRSNRESGRGRPDVLIRPRNPGRPGAVLELKVARPRQKTLEQALQEGLEQTKSKAYAAELRASGATPIHAFVLAFDGKIVEVRTVQEAALSGGAGHLR